jgi:hypothetical protein
MGWLDYHLHEYRFDGPSRDEALLIGIPSDEIWDDSPEVQPGWDIPVFDFLSEPGDRAEYEYDFGDGWVHEVTLLGVEPREKGQRYPKCVVGERACPPEDCGGVSERCCQTAFSMVHCEWMAVHYWCNIAPN